MGRLCFGPTSEAGLPALIIEPRLRTEAFSLHSAAPSQLIPPNCSLSIVRGGLTTPSNAGLPASSPRHLEEEVFPATSSSRLHKCRWCGKWGSSRTNQEARFGLPAPHVVRPLSYCDKPHERNTSSRKHLEGMKLTKVVHGTVDRWCHGLD